MSDPNNPWNVGWDEEVPSVKVLSETLNIKPTDKCASCGTTELATLPMIYHYSSKMYSGAWVLGCSSCFLKDKASAKYKEFVRTSTHKHVTIFTLHHHAQSSRS